jgi:2-hydroxychromene-2-carboxylate isomerase
VTKRSPRFYFSFRSPYAWIAARWLEEKLDPAQYEIEYIPFWEPDNVTLSLLREVNGDFLYIPMSRQKHLYILQDIKRITTELHYKMAWPIDRDPWWDLPHLAYLAACRSGRGRQFFWAVYRARWEEGRDICSADQLRDIARTTGLNPDDVAKAPDDRDIRIAGAEALLRAYRDGVFGIPFFIKGVDKFWGIDRMETFVKSLHT